MDRRVLSFLLLEGVPVFIFNVSLLPAESVSVGQRKTGGHQIRGLPLHSHLHQLATLLVCSVPSVSGLDLSRTRPQLGAGGSLKASGGTLNPERREEQLDQLFWFRPKDTDEPREEQPVRGV